MLAKRKTMGLSLRTVAIVWKVMIVPHNMDLGRKYLNLKKNWAAPCYNREGIVPRLTCPFASPGKDPAACQMVQKA